MENKIKYAEIFERIDEMIKREFSKEFIVKSLPNQEGTFEWQANITIEYSHTKYSNPAVYQKNFNEINTEI